MTDNPEQASRRLPYWLIILLALALGAIVLALPPGRKMLDLIGFESVGPGTPEGPLATLLAIPGRAATTSFGVDQGLLVVEFPVRPDSGSLAVKPATGAMAELLVADARGGEVVEVFASGIRVRNTEGSQAYYRLAVPERVNEVEVRVAGIMLARLPAPRELEWEVDLASGPHRLNRANQP